MPKDLANLFYPKSIAIVGASDAKEKLGSIVLRNITTSGYKGKVYPVNPHYQQIDTLTCYKDIASLPEIPELVVLAIPSAFVLDVINQAGASGVKNAVVFAAGYKEVGADGAKMEKDLIEACTKHGINLIGPNCLGFVNNNCPVNVTFGTPPKDDGNLKFISQSGAIATSLFDWCNFAGLGFSDFVTLGNKAVLNETDILEYLHTRSQNQLYSHTVEGLSSVNPIGMYLESITNGEAFLKITSEITKKDPIFVLKPGKTQAAAHAMQSHTGAIAGEDSVLDAVLTQAGVIRCQTMEDFFDLSRAFAWEEAPLGPKIAIISNAGGPGVISADAVATSGLELTEIDAQTKEHLYQVLPRSASILNPIDVLGDALADRYLQAADIILKLENVHALLVILTPQVMTQIEKTAEYIGGLSKKYNKPIFCSFIGGNMVSEGEQKLNQYKIPSFRFPERAIYAIGKMWQFRKQQMAKALQALANETVDLSQDGSAVRAIVQKAINGNLKALDNIDANAVVTSIGIPAPVTQFVDSVDQAKQFAKTNGWPVVLKLSSPGLLHKKDVGGVILDIMNDVLLDDAMHKMSRKIDELEPEIKKGVKIQIQKGIQYGVEVIVGIKTDPTFGPVLLFGAGGSYAELIADRNLHLLPMNKAQVKALVENSRIYALLKKQVGDMSYPLDKLYDLILRVSKLTTVIPEASEVEINPVIVTLNDVWAVDTKVVMKQGQPKSANLPKMHSATTLSNKILASKFHHYEFETDQPMPFKPGQYINVKVATDAFRAYSIATRTSPTKFELLVDTRPGGPGSKYFESLKAGDKIPFLGPFGVFTFNDKDDAENILMLATGSGISAIRCMIDVALLENNFKKPINLYFGLTFEEEIFWQDHFEDLAKKYPNFKYKFVLYKPTPNWQGAKGFITEHVVKDFPDASKSAAYMCGHRAMISDATDLLLANGCPKARIYTERFI